MADDICLRHFLRCDEGTKTGTIIIIFIVIVIRVNKNVASFDHNKTVKTLNDSNIWI